MATFSEALASAGSLYGQIPFPLLVLGHSLTVCAFFKGAHGDRYLLNFFVSFIGGFGGGILSALLMQVCALPTLSACWLPAIREPPTRPVHTAVPGT